MSDLLILAFGDYDTEGAAMAAWRANVEACQAAGFTVVVDGVAAGPD